MNEIEEKVVQIVSQALNVDKDKVTLESSFVDDLGADSLDQVELMMALEDGFGLNIPDEEASKIITIADAVKYVQQKQ
jgi:acyl carrier protein